MEINGNSHFSLNQFIQLKSYLIIFYLIINLNFIGGPDVVCAYWDDDLEKVVELMGVTDDPTKYIKCYTDHFTTFTSTKKAGP